MTYGLSATCLHSMTCAASDYPWVDRWKGETVVCIASGASLTEEQCSYTKGRARVITINDSFRLAPHADVFYACDHRWWERYRREVEAFAGERWTMDERAAREFGIHHVLAQRQQGLNTERGRINHGCNSGFQVINLAYQFGAGRILLLGYDYQHTHGKRHWFGDHPAGWGNANRPERWLENIATIESPVPIINCTTHTAIPESVFPRARLEDVL